MAAQKIRIRLKSFEVNHMAAACDKIIAAATATDATISGPVPLPTKRRIYCVLRSPHVNKVGAAVTVHKGPIALEGTTWFGDEDGSTEEAQLRHASQGGGSWGGGGVGVGGGVGGVGNSTLERIDIKW